MDYKGQLSGDDEKFQRMVANAQIAGHRGIVLDEFGETPRLYEKISQILQISSTLTYRPLYGEQRKLPLHVAFYMPCVSFPAVLYNSPEFCRRVRHIRLPRAVPQWHKICGGDTLAWRDRSPENAKIANSILTHTWRMCRRHEFEFFAVAEELGLSLIDEGHAVASDELYRDCYRICRGEKGGVEYLKSYGTSRPSFVSISDPKLAPLVRELVPLDEPGEEKYARQNLQRMLESVDWNSKLGIDSPAIRCVVKVHGRTCGIKFEEDAPGLRGSQKVNEQLPPIPAVAVAPSPGDPSAALAQSSPAPATPAGHATSLAQTLVSPPPSIASSAEYAAAMESLKKAGMPQ